jgi:uncharacterized protein YbbC (DUF1343 family)
MVGELEQLSIGVGYTMPFKLFGQEWIDSRKLTDKLQALNIPGVFFRPLSYKPYYGRLKDKNVQGVQLHITDYSRLNLMSLQFLFMQVHNELYPQKNPLVTADSARMRMFDKVAGSDQVRKLFTQRMAYADVEKFLNKDVGSFKATSKQYLLY